MNKSIRVLINYLVGPLLFILLSWSLYGQINNQPDVRQRWIQIKNSWDDLNLLLVILLMFVNWGIESKKWQLLINHVQPFTFLKAYKSVLSGCSVTMLTPNRIGEYGGRILYVETGKRIKAISLTIVGSISQLLVTMIMGCVGLFYVKFMSPHKGALDVLPEFWGEVLIYLTVGITVILLLFYLRLGWLVRAMEKVPALQKIVNHIRVLDEFNSKQLVNILLLSLVRYLVFVLQYVLMLQLMHVEVAPLLCFWLMSVFYLVMAIAPTIGFIELPVRVSASWIILKHFTGNELGVGTAALAIWLINLVIPAIIGSLLILSIKIIKEK